MSRQATSLREVIQRLNALDGSDPETAHEEADRLLLDALLLFRDRQGVVAAYLEAKERVGFGYD